MGRQRIQDTEIHSESAVTDEGREMQCITLAMNLVEERLRNGTASSQETVHFLRLGSTKERLEKELLAKQVELARAKTESIRNADEIKALYEEAIRSFAVYNGTANE